MSFSFSAAGSKEQTLDSLSKAQTNDNSVGERVKKFLAELVEHDKTDGGETHDIRHEVAASGHSDGGVGSSSYANISYVTKLVPKPEPSEPAAEPETTQSK